jgi:hypothetical protein
MRFIQHDNGRSLVEDSSLPKLHSSIIAYSAL